MVKTTVVLLNLGGPDNLDSVKPFLQNLFADPDIFKLPGGKFSRKLLSKFIISRRLERVKNSYARIGGGSPLRRLMDEFGAAIEKNFNGEVQVVNAMRYWHPLTSETIESIPSSHNVLLFSLYPHACIATTGSAFNEVERVLERTGKRFASIKRVECYPEDSRFIASWVEMISAAFAKKSFVKESTKLIFSAHGIPLKMARSGDSYETQIRASVKRIVEMLPEHMRVDHELAFQSRVGPVRWLEPNVVDVVKRLRAQRIETAVVVPISFTVENLETLFELDVELAELAHENGVMDFRRVTTPSGSEIFVQAACAMIRKNF